MGSIPLEMTWIPLCLLTKAIVPDLIPAGIIKFHFEPKERWELEVVSFTEPSIKLQGHTDYPSRWLMGYWMSSTRNDHYFIYWVDYIFGNSSNGHITIVSLMGSIPLEMTWIPLFLLTEAIVPDLIPAGIIKFHFEPKERWELEVVSFTEPSIKLQGHTDYPSRWLMGYWMSSTRNDHYFIYWVDYIFGNSSNGHITIVSLMGSIPLEMTWIPLFLLTEAIVPDLIPAGIIKFHFEPKERWELEVVSFTEPSIKLQGHTDYPSRWLMGYWMSSTRNDHYFFSKLHLNWGYY